MPAAAAAATRLHSSITIQPLLCKKACLKGDSEEQRQTSVNAAASSPTALSPLTHRRLLLLDP